MNKFMEITLRNFFHGWRRFPLADEESAAMRNSGDIAERVRFLRTWLKWSLKLDLTLPLETIWYVSLYVSEFRWSGITRMHLGVYWLYLMDRFHCWFKDYPRIVLKIAAYDFIQEVLGPMIYWPLQIFRKPILWTIWLIFRIVRGF